MEADAFDVFKAAVGESQIALDAYVAKNEEFIAQNPRIAEGIAAVQEKLDGLNVNLDESGGKAEEFATGFVQGMRGAAASVNTLSKAGQQLGGFFANELTDGLVDVFVEGRKSFKEFLTDFLKGLAIMIAKIIILNAISAIGRGTSIFSAGGNTGGMFTRRQTFQANTGALVPGRGPNRDSVNARLTPGEYVHTRKSVDYYGADVMRAINQRLIPRSLLALGTKGGRLTSAMRSGFQTGGPVGGTGERLTSEDDVRPTMAFIVPDEQGLDRQVAGGEETMRRFLEDNSELIRSLAGGVR